MLTAVALTVPSAPAWPVTVRLTPGLMSAREPVVDLLITVPDEMSTLTSWPVVGLWIVTTVPLTAVTWPAVAPRPANVPPPPVVPGLAVAAAAGRLATAAAGVVAPTFDCEYR